MKSDWKAVAEASPYGAVRPAGGEHNRHRCLRDALLAEALAPVEVRELKAAE